MKKNFTEDFKNATKNIKDFDALLNILKSATTNLNIEDIAFVVAMLLTGVMMIAGVSMTQMKNDAIKNIKPAVIKETQPDNEPDEAPENTDEKSDKTNQSVGATRKHGLLTKIYNPQDDDFTQNVIKDNWPHIVAGLLEFETWHTKDMIKIPKGASRATYGPGLTYVYTKNADGKWQQHECKGKYMDMAKKMSDAEIWNQVKVHLNYGGTGLSKIKYQLNQHGVTEISAQQVLGLLFAAYQTPTQILTVIDNIQNANTDTETLNAFGYYNGRKVYTEGTLKRRWWCALYYMGKINSADLINSKTDGFANKGYDILQETISPDNEIIQKLRSDSETILKALQEAKKFHKHTVAEIIEKTPSLKTVHIALKEYMKQIEKEQALTLNNQIPMQQTQNQYTY